MGLIYLNSALIDARLSSRPMTGYPAVYLYRFYKHIFISLVFFMSSISFPLVYKSDAIQE
jgi:hypothetical protein